MYWFYNMLGKGMLKEWIVDVVESDMIWGGQTKVRRYRRLK